MDSQKIAQPIAPVRGIVCTHNAQGQTVSSTDLRRWLRLSRVVFKTLKADVFIGGKQSILLSNLLDAAEDLELRLSLRVSAGDVSLTDLAPLDPRLLDVFLAPVALESAALDPSLEICRRAGLPVRLHVLPPFRNGIDFHVVAQNWADAGVVAVDVGLHEPFTGVEAPPCADAGESSHRIEAINAMARALREAGIEASLADLPFCLADSDNRPWVVNTRQFFADHQHYQRRAWVFARDVYQARPAMAGKAIAKLLGRHTSYDNPIDRKLLPWILDRPWWRARVWALHKLTRHIPLLTTTPAPREDIEAFDTPPPRVPRHPACQKCALRWICDQDSELMTRQLPGALLEAVAGEPLIWPLHLSSGQARYCDEIDGVRMKDKADRDDMAAQAIQTTRTRPADVELSPFNYELEGLWCHQVQGGVRWHAYTSSEKRTTPLGSFEAPFTLSATFGGGIAEFIGFAFGQDVRVLCPMEAYSHTLLLHVASDGRYVLVRDGTPVRPVEFESRHYAPLRLPLRTEPRLCAWNIDGTIVTQSTMVWHGDKPQERAAKRFSVLIVCSRYARRLQSALLSIAHQQGLELCEIEVLVAYVPGIDPTDDVLDSIEAAFPELAIVRMPYPPESAGRKGYLINESVRGARGEWVVLLDADILVPTDFFAQLGAVPEDTCFVAPNGRKMLNHNTTARILLGEIKPWEVWQDMLKEAGEFRYREVDGIPIGYLQAVRRICFESVCYQELSHFEGADWQFGKDMRARFGPEQRLSGSPVLHLDHGGSKWYGTAKQY